MVLTIINYIGRVVTVERKNRKEICIANFSHTIKDLRPGIDHLFLLLKVVHMPI